MIKKTSDIFGFCDDCKQENYLFDSCSNHEITNKICQQCFEDRNSHDLDKWDRFIAWNMRRHVAHKWDCWPYCQHKPLMHIYACNSFNKSGKTLFVGA